MRAYPEHDKLTALAGANETLGAFLDWINEKGWRLMEWRTVNVEYSSGFHKEQEALAPVQASNQMMLAEFFGIDLVKLEAEKIQMLSDLSDSSGRGGTN